MSDDEEKQEKTLFGYMSECIIILAFLLFVNWYWPESFPVKLFEYFYFSQTSIQQALVASTPIFIWAVSINAIIAVVKTFTGDIEKEHIRNCNSVLTDGFVISLIAGVFEELIFRWILFYSAMIAIPIFSYLFFGWISSWFEMSRLFMQYIIMPLTQFFSFGYLDWLYEKHWLITAGAIVANAKFRDGHKYQGLFGVLNSWAIGFYLFWIMFNYGLPAAIVVHFTYDFIIFAFIFLFLKSKQIVSRDDDDLDDVFGYPIPRRPRPDAATQRVYNEN